MTQPLAAPADTATATGAAPKSPPATARRGRPENLVRYPKGQLPEHLKRHQQDPERVQITKRTLLAELTRALHAKSGAKLQQLAESIIDNAIKGNSTCLQLIADRLMPLEQGQGQGRTVFEGIKLEVVGGAEGARTTIALVRGSESHRELPQQDAPDSSVAETPRVIEGVKLDSSESQDS